MTAVDSTFPEAAVLERIQKLLNLAAKNDNPEEAAGAAAKAQEMLARYNLDVATLEQHTAAGQGKREHAKVVGGTYQFQRELWRAVAELNFCLYWTQEYDEWVKSKRHGNGRDRWTAPGNVRKRRHALVGRIVNTRATIALATYLEQALERALAERLHDYDHTQRFSRWAVSFKKGATRRLVEKLEDRRNKMEEAEAAAVRAHQADAERAGQTTATGVTLASVKKSERDANLDHVHGEGYSARKAALEAKRARDHAEREAAYARWAAANPEEARRRALEAEEMWEKAAKRSRARFRGGRGTSDDVDNSAYWDGYDKAEKISLDQQVDGAGKVAGRLK